MESPNNSFEIRMPAFRAVCLMARHWTPGRNCKHSKIGFFASSLRRRITHSGTFKVIQWGNQQKVKALIPKWILHQFVFPRSKWVESQSTKAYRTCKSDSRYKLCVSRKLFRCINFYILTYIHIHTYRYVPGQMHTYSHAHIHIHKHRYAWIHIYIYDQIVRVLGQLPNNE